MSGEGYALRPARADEVEAVLRIEDDAGRMYGEAGIPEDLPGMPRQEVEHAIESGLLWVAADAEDRPVAFALCWLRPGAIHLRELDVHPSHMRRALGRRLVEHVRAQARARGLARVTLTTFAEVPWNAPLYRRYGFVEIAREAMPSWLAEIRDEEDGGVLASWPRIAMTIDT